MKLGWISLQRKIQEHWIWTDKPFSKGQAFIDLLLKANFEDNKFLFNNALIEVKRGSFITSELKLMESWGWSKSKVRAFLTLLENESMIIKSSDNKKTTLTILNYDTYQDMQTAKEPQKNHRKTAKEPQKDTSNNYNNINNDNNDNKRRNMAIFDFSNYDINITDAIKNYIDFRKTIKNPIKTQNRLDKLYKDTMELSNNDVQLATQIIQQSIDLEYLDVYPLKNKKPYANNNHPAPNNTNRATKRDELTVAEFLNDTGASVNDDYGDVPF